MKCPCCGIEQSTHASNPYCDDCDTDACGHWTRLDACNVCGSSGACDNRVEHEHIEYVDAGGVDITWWYGYDGEWVQGIGGYDD